jgi:hypothetical protein
MCRALLATLATIATLLPSASAQPRQQRRQPQPDAGTLPEPPLLPAVTPAQEAWSAALAEFDATSGEHMHQANLDLEEGRIASACVTYDYLHKGLRGNPVLLTRSEADVAAVRAALGLPVRLKRNAVRDFNFRFYLSLAVRDWTACSL